MSDLPHVYTTDIQFQESECFAAPTQFSAQRLGQNINFLLGEFGPLFTLLTSIANDGAKFVPFTADGTYGPGSNTIYTSAETLIGAIIQISPIRSSEPTSALDTGPFSPPVITYGPPIPIIAAWDGAPNNRTYMFDVGVGSIKAGARILSNPTWNDVSLLISGGTQAFSISGVAIHG